MVLNKIYLYTREFTVVYTRHARYYYEQSVTFWKVNKQDRAYDVTVILQKKQACENLKV